MIFSYQKFEDSPNKPEAALKLIEAHKNSEDFQNAVIANFYDRQRNITINDYVKKIYSLSGRPIVDFTASNAKIASNFFRRLNVQRNTYSLGNGIQFENEDIKKKLGGKHFDTLMSKAGYDALKHGKTFLFWNLDHIVEFKLTEFVPLWDEETGELKAGIRFWQLDIDTPLMFVIYELDGYTNCKAVKKSITVEEKKPYKTKIKQTAIGETLEVVGENYPTFPIVPFLGSELGQSTIVGLRQSIDSYDLIRSGFANTLMDCAQIYWLIKGCDGMDENALAMFRDRLLLNHIASVPNDENASVEPYTQSIPYEARMAYLDSIRHGIYEDFGALDTSLFSGGEKTATEIRAMYQPLDENADDYEYCIIEAIMRLEALAGLPDEVPKFKRNRIANEREAVEVVAMEAAYLDDETILRKLPNITVDEVDDIIKRKAAEGYNKFNSASAEGL